MIIGYNVTRKVNDMARMIEIEQAHWIDPDTVEQCDILIPEGGSGDNDDSSYVVKLRLRLRRTGTAVEMWGPYIYEAMHRTYTKERANEIMHQIAVNQTDGSPAEDDRIWCYDCGTKYPAEHTGPCRCGSMLLVGRE